MTSNVTYELRVADYTGAADSGVYRKERWIREVALEADNVAAFRVWSVRLWDDGPSWPPADGACAVTVELDGTLSAKCDLRGMILDPTGDEIRRACQGPVYAAAGVLPWLPYKDDGAALRDNLGGAG
jgi:hypothetical protein